MSAAICVLSAMLHSLGNASAADLGVLPGAGEKTQAGSYDAGEVKLYEFEVPIGVLAMEVRLEDRVGNPEMNLRSDTNFPYGASYAPIRYFSHQATILTRLKTRLRITSSFADMAAWAVGLEERLTRFQSHSWL